MLCCMQQDMSRCEFASALMGPSGFKGQESMTIMTHENDQREIY